MKISQNFSVTEENFPDQSTWIGRLLAPLSAVLENMLLALTGNLSIGDNVIGTVQTFTVNTDPNYATGKFTPLRILWGPGSFNPPKAVLVGRVVTPSNQPKTYTAITAQDWSYDFGSNSILINYVSGLTASSTYTITFQCT